MNDTRVHWLNPNLMTVWHKHTACGMPSKTRETSSDWEKLTCDDCTTRAKSYYKGHADAIGAPRA